MPVNSSVCRLSILVGMASASATHAQAPVARSTPAVIIADPSRLPGDAPPASLDRMLQLPRPHLPTTPDATPGPLLDLAVEAARTALDTCTAKGYHIGAAVTDSEGNLLVGLTAAGAMPGRIYTAVQKDLAAIAWRRPTSAVQILLRVDLSSAATLLRPNMVVVPGGVPLFVGDRLIGAIGASGATGDEDEACAKAGAARIGDRLR